MLHHIFQRTGVLPSVVMGQPRFLRTFLLASMEVQLEAEAEREAALARQRQWRNPEVEGGDEPWNRCSESKSRSRQ